LQVFLGTIDVPGGHRAKAPFPRHIPPPVKPAKEMSPNTPLKSPPLGFRLLLKTWLWMIRADRCASIRLIPGRRPSPTMA
jgi:hypothetical protein